MNGDLTIRELYELLKSSQEEQTQKLTKEIQKQSLENNRRIEKTEKNIKNLQNKYVYVERNMRKNNIIIFGLQINSEHLLSETIKTINSLLELNLVNNDINNIFYIGKQENKKGILIQFVSYLKKQQIFKNIAKLKGQKIAIVHDLCPEDQRRQKILIKHLKLAKSQNQQAKIKGFKLEIDNILYSAEELENNCETNSELYTDVEEEIEEEEIEEVRSEVCEPSISERKAKTSGHNKRKRVKKNSPVQRITRLNAKYL